ncbi:beta-phosphoglucomutase [Carnobacterium divergens]|uniref:beta-phosphoglucomutase n=1 Tax=Carnobacterium divergens TaxID=2748 RepID=UPI001071A163|nr:beta-phosphoglucomutase [Carnobacterium divergens]TFI74031.1 beta-phosphoglucomutase [Carnobacterium divergens]
MKAVLFDLDGVITDTAHYHYKAWRWLGEEIGVVVDEAFNEELKGISRTESLEKILEKGNLTTKYTQAEKNKLATKKNDVYQKMIEEMTPNDLLPGIQELLLDLKEKQLKIGLASASQNGPFILAKLNIADLFDTIVDPTTLKAGKPAPDIFIQGAKQLAVDPTDCVGVEDAIAGVTAICAANMAAIGVGDAVQLKQATKVVPRTDWLTYPLLEQAWQDYRNEG